MEKKLSEESMNFLNDPSFKGRAWLTTKNGRRFLKDTKCLEWLVSREGLNWLDSPETKTWVLEEENSLSDHMHQMEYGLLKSSVVQEWLTKTEKGKLWLATGHGYAWLKTLEGHAWMETPSGKEFMSVPKELIPIEG
jgi:hypothetical protein